MTSNATDSQIHSDKVTLVNFNESLKVEEKEIPDIESPYQFQNLFVCTCTARFSVIGSVGSVGSPLLLTDRHSGGVGDSGITGSKIHSVGDR